MVERINDIAWQAHQGSVAAIIQLLNEKLASSGIRTRAIFDDGVLQLLCEARTVAQLEQSTLVKHIQQILESIAPRNICRVNINSRIVREQQLLWLEEINRNPENQLLWSQEITLVKPNIFKQKIKELKERTTQQGKTNLPKPQFSPLSVVTHNNKIKNSPVGRMLGAASFCMFFLSLGVAAYALLGNKLKNPIQPETLNSLAPVTTNQKQPEVPPPTASPNGSTFSVDPFAAAVRIANKASATGKTATSSAQWLDLAARWQRASELMSAVPPNHSRYQEAQLRTKLYKKYSQAAEEESKKRSS
ncbi:hypothetical protein SAMD00079811_13930 [Scytonema sp. HK-05]|uniref:hypothetical protein n=1 Tax=Scytonema sp. HK-05 TaxID=1137095 RepID=UPI000935CE62|nr:hypothetical protein [Scytonema sp. HK-05]OKH48595.1 hypothetical protein NIES2130_35340 [Scytonema sp. HK-05]BAY43807.1 hypothetical protein SAMD00079811_13930 [Scytonema sp. HK-05]